MKKTLIALATFGLLTAAHAQDMTVPDIKKANSPKMAQNVVKFRKSLFQLIRSNMGPLGAMAKGQIPYDQARMQVNALRLSQLSMMLPDYLSYDTSGFDAKTKAKSEVWSDWQGFNEKAQALYAASMALQDVAAAGDESKYRAAIGKVGGSCKGCHDDYKAE